MTPADVLKANAPLTAAQVGALIADEFPNPVVDDLAPFSILVAERHFLRPHDDLVVNFASSLGRRCRITFHISLEDPLMKKFAGDWIREILGNLGMKESDPIESRMVARRIQAAQAKFAKQVTDEQKAKSAEEWLELNVGS